MANPLSSLSGALILAAAILYIFVGIANFTLDQLVPRHLRFITITTDGLGAAITRSAPSVSGPGSVYGNPNADSNFRNPGDGLRFYYTWGLWNRCAGYYGRSDPQYCTGTSWAHRFHPTQSLLEDVPISLQAQTSNLLNDQFNSDDYFGLSTRIAFYFIFISAALTGLILISNLFSYRGPTRVASLGLSSLALLAFISATIGTVIWTAVAGILKHQLDRDFLNLGMEADYGNAIWLMWAIDGTLLLASIAYLGGCIAGRSRHTV